MQFFFIKKLHASLLSSAFIKKTSAATDEQDSHQKHTPRQQQSQKHANPQRDHQGTDPSFSPLIHTFSAHRRDPLFLLYALFSSLCLRTRKNRNL